MPRDWQLRIADIIEACAAVQDYTRGMNFEEFLNDRKTRDAVIRNLAIIGEAAKDLPPEARALAPTIDWRDVCGMKDILTHEYFRVDEAIVWNVVEAEIPKLLTSLQAMSKSDDATE